VRFFGTAIYIYLIYKGLILNKGFDIGLNICQVYISYDI
jgi:hypothetical protein